mgnify:FL=1
MSLDDSLDYHGGTVVYDDNFALGKVDCQEHLLTMCQGISIRQDLVQPHSEQCVLDSFQIWLKRTHGHVPFPVPFPPATPKESLPYLLYQFVTKDPIGKRFKSYVLFDRVPSGLKDDVAKIIGLVAMFYSVERSYVGGFPAMTTYKQWDELMAFVNQDAPASAGPAFHTRCVKYLVYFQYRQQYAHTGSDHLDC